MKRCIPVALAVILGLCGILAVSRTAPASVDVQLQVGEAPPAPSFVFEDEPEVILVPSTRVYYVPNLEFDLFRYGRYWYINHDGWWYRARGYRGPFVYLEYENVPMTIIRVPAKYHRHPMGGPPLRAIEQSRALGLDRGESGRKKGWR